MEYPKRKQLRLPDYDYGETGAYFITICTKDRKPLFGAVGADSISARMVESVFQKTLMQYPTFSSPIFVVMPNHFHALIEIQRADTGSAPTIPSFVQAFKRATTVEYIKLVKQGFAEPFQKQVWQRSYYDHVVRTDRDYLQVWQYIDNNPAKWAEDEYYQQ